MKDCKIQAAQNIPNQLNREDYRQPSQLRLKQALEYVRSKSSNQATKHFANPGKTGAIAGKGAAKNHTDVKTAANRKQKIESDEDSDGFRSPPKISAKQVNYIDIVVTPKKQQTSARGISRQRQKELVIKVSKRETLQKNEKANARRINLFKKEPLDRGSGTKTPNQARSTSNRQKSAKIDPQRNHLGEGKIKKKQIKVDTENTLKSYISRKTDFSIGSQPKPWEDNGEGIEDSKYDFKIGEMLVGNLQSPFK